jgi:hypothetical protein
VVGGGGRGEASEEEIVAELGAVWVVRQQQISASGGGDTLKVEVRL